MEHRLPRRGARFVRLLALLIIVIMTTAQSCGTTAAPEPTTYDGIWSGAFKFMYDIGTATVTVDKDRACCIEATVSGTLEQWGGSYRMDVEGDLIIQVDGRVAGQIALVRYCPGRDTCATTIDMSGQFELEAKGIYYGEWQTVPGAPFTAGGTWGATKIDP